MREAMRHTTYAALAFLVAGIMLFSCTSFGRRLAWSFFSPFAGIWRSGSALASNLIPKGNSRDTRLLELELRVRELEARLAQTAELEKANAQLRALQQLPELPSWEAVAADIISRDPTQWNKGFVINKGLSSGIRSGSAVMSGTYMIGRIVESNRHSAQAATVLSPECRFSVTVQGTDAVGICTGANTGDWRGNPHFQIDFLPGGLCVEPGQRVLTSGLGGGIPGSLPVGEVVADEAGQTLQVIENSRGRLFCLASGDLQNVRHVVVLCPVRARMADENENTGRE
jgi:cell shape-determining protein MreC